MKKRLVKVFGEQLSDVPFAPLPTDHAINVVLKSGDTLLGTLLQQNKQEIQIRDGRFHNHRIQVADIDVVIYDHSSSF